MSNEERSTQRLRRVLDTRQRQALINDHERAWLNALKSKGFDAGRHPFLAAGDSEAIEARFFEMLRRGVPFERSMAIEDLAAVTAALADLPEAVIEHAVVVFSPMEGVLGAFVTSGSEALPRLGGLAEFTKYELGVTTLDAAHGVAIEHGHYTEAGQYVTEGVILLRAWGDFVPRL